MRLAVRVHYKDGRTAETVAQFADFIDFERTWQRSVRRFEEELRLTDVAWLAWSSLTRSKNATAKFAPDWIETVESCEVFEDEESKAADDTRPT
jgi:hypothetical protein